MDFGSPEVTNGLLAFLAFAWGAWGWRMDKRVTVMETKHALYHKTEAIPLGE